MDRIKFEEKVEEYLLFNKRALAEMLAMRDLKEESKDIDQPKVEYKTRKFCTGGYQDFCCNETCDGCLFNQLKSTAKTFGFVTTSTTEIVK